MEIPATKESPAAEEGQEHPLAASEPGNAQVGKAGPQAAASGSPDRETALPGQSLASPHSASLAQTRLQNGAGPYVVGLAAGLLPDFSAWAVAFSWFPVCSTFTDLT